MKIALSTYSLWQYQADGRMNQLDCIAAAKEMGFDAIEFVNINPHDGSTPEDYAKKLREECERLQLPVTNLTIGADLLNGGEKAIEEVCHQIDLAEILGAEGLRHDATGGYRPGERKWRGFDDALPIVADACRKITEYGASKGIHTMVENHGTFCQDSRRVEKLVNTVAHENFGLLCDMGNFLCADEDPAKSFGIVAPYATYVHAKDFHVKDGNMPHPGYGFNRIRNGKFIRGAIIGHGDVPVRQCLYALKFFGYTGNIGIEFEGIEDCKLGIRVGLENLRKMIAEIDSE